MDEKNKIENGEIVEFTLKTFGGRNNIIKIDGNVMEIANSKIDLRFLYELFDVTNPNSFAEALNDQNQCVSMLMAAIINEGTNSKDIAPSVHSLDLIYRLTMFIGMLEVK